MEPNNDLPRAQRIAQGDSKEAERFLREFYPGVYRFLGGLVHLREDAEDVTQQALLRALRDIHRYREVASLRTWVHRIAFFEYTKWRRRQRFVWRIPADHVYQESAFGSLLEAQWLRSALVRLPARQREAFVLFEIQELSLDEIAYVAGVPVGTVKSRIHHARKRLRVLLSESEEIPTDEIPVLKTR